MWLKKFDHCAIYLLIAGTYTPFLLVGLDSPLARGLMIVIWSPALLGILFKLTIAHRFKILSLVTYLAMGWLSLVVIYEMAVKLAAGSVTLLAVGGVVYSLGVIFYGVCKPFHTIMQASGTALCRRTCDATRLAIYSCILGRHRIDAVPASAVFTTTLSHHGILLAPPSLVRYSSLS